MIASLLPSGPGQINRREAISDTQFHQHEQVHHQEQLPSSAWKFRQIQAFSFAHLLNAIAVHPPQQNHPANNWWGIINIPRQAAFPKGKRLFFFKTIIGYLCYLSVHMSTRLLMDVPYMLVRKLLATPRELAHERSALLVDSLNMLLQIGFLQFQVHQEWITK